MPHVCYLSDVVYDAANQRLVFRGAKKPMRDDLSNEYLLDIDLKEHGLSFEPDSVFHLCGDE